MTTRTFGTVLICSFSGILAGQSPESQVGFEVAAIKSVAPAADGLPHRRGGPGTSDPDRFSYSNVTLDVLIRVAYGDRRPFQVAGPSWLTSNRYDVTAKVPTAATQEQFNRMLLNLLIERFHLAVHHETRDFTACELTLAKNGPRLKESAQEQAADTGKAEPFRPDPTRLPALPSGPGIVVALRIDRPSRIAARAKPMADFAQALQGAVGGTPVIDKTGLTGKYDFVLDFDLRSGNSAADPSDPPGLFVAIQEQLGLRLEEKKQPFDVIVVDHADKEPGEN